MKRIVNLTSAKRKRILERDKYICCYCGERAEQVDHVIPYTWTIFNNESNLVACCGRCNVIAGNKMFDSIEQKRAYILSRRQRKGDNFVVALPIEAGASIERKKRARKSEAKPKRKKHSLRYLLNRVDAKIEKYKKTGHW